MDDRPKYQRLKQTIKQNIRDGIWKPGEKLPAENSLCEHFGVSKITVKKAKDELIAEGVLESVPGKKGIFIRKLYTIPPSGFIAFAIDDINDSPFIEVFKGIEDRLWQDKLHITLANLYSDPEKAEVYFRSLLQGDIVGIIFAPVRGAGYSKINQNIITLLTEAHIPYVLLDRYLPDCLYNSVVSNNRQASGELTRLLINKGHSRILTFAGMACSSMDARVQGYLEAFGETGLAHDPNLLIRTKEVLLLGDHDQQRQELERVKRLVEKAGEFTACYLMNIPLHTVLRTIFPDGKDANKEIEFVTYDDVSQDLRMVTTRALVVKQPGYKMGWEAARLLIKNFREPDQGVAQITLKSEIIEQVFE